MDDGPDMPASWNDEGSGGGHGRLWLVLGGLVVVALVAGGVLYLLKKKEESKVAWPASVNGRAPGLGEPKQPPSEVDLGADPGVYAWSDFDGWHLWVANGDGTGPVTGTISSDKDFVKAALAVKGAGTLERDGSEISFELPAKPGLVGVDFQPGFYAKKLTFDLDGPDGPVPPKSVTLGTRRTVDDVPFTVEMVPQDDAPSS